MGYRGVVAAVAFALLTTVGCDDGGGDEMRKDVLAVGMYSGKGSEPKKLARTLRGWGFAVTLVGKDVLQHLEPGDFDILYLPGGWYHFESKVNRKIIDFVRKGGGCVGSCAGAYNVAGHIPIVPGRTLRCNVRGRLYLEPQQGSHPILRGVVRKCTRHKDRKWEPIAVTHLGGPMIFPEQRSTIVASYDLEGEIGAIVASDVGKGRAVALASHPEHDLAPLPPGDTARRNRKPLPQGDETLILRNAVLWAAKRQVPER